jgi:hypothetical protein
MRRAKTLGFLIVLAVYMGLARPETVHAQRGSVHEPPTHQRRVTRSRSGTEGHAEPPHRSMYVPPPIEERFQSGTEGHAEHSYTEDSESPDHKRRNAETKRRQAREGHRGSFGWIFGIGRERTTWERSGCETPREEARFRVDGAGRIAETKPAGYAPLRPEACVILPKVDAYKNVFGHEPSGAEAKGIRAYEEQYREQKVEVLGERGVGEDELKAWVESRARSGVRPVGVIGHSTFRGAEQGLVLPNGDRVPFVRIHQWATEAGSECVFETCYGKDLGLTERIRFDDALAMWQGAVRAMNEGPSLGSAILSEVGEATGEKTDSKGLSFGSETASEKGEATGEKTDSLESFAANLSRVRWERGARSIDLTVSTPGNRPLGGAPASDPGEVVIWNLPMARPDRILMIAALLLSGFGLLHHTMYRVGQKPIGFQPTSTESFRRAMMAVFRYLKAYRHTGVAIAGITLLLALSTYLSGTELFMDWQERRAGGRWQVHTASIIGASLASLASAIYLMKPGRSVLGTLSHGLGGLIVGATTAWVTFFAFCPFIGVRFGLFGAVVFGTLGGIVACVGNGSGAFDGFSIGFGLIVGAIIARAAFTAFDGKRFRLFWSVVIGTLGVISVLFFNNIPGAIDGILIGCGFLVVYGIFGGCLLAIWGLFVGWGTAVDESSVHEATINMVCTLDINMVCTLDKFTHGMRGGTRGTAILIGSTCMGVILVVVTLCVGIVTDDYSEIVYRIDHPPPQADPDAIRPLSKSARAIGRIDHPPPQADPDAIRPLSKSAGRIDPLPPRRPIRLHRSVDRSVTRTPPPGGLPPSRGAGLVAAPDSARP